MVVLLDCLDCCKSSKAKALRHRLQTHVVRDTSYCRKSKRITESSGDFAELQDRDFFWY